MNTLIEKAAAFLLLCALVAGAPIAIGAQSESKRFEYLWYEAENMRGFSRNERGEPISNPSWSNPPKSKAPGWGMNGPGVSAEWTQGGESEWNSAASSADETSALIYQDLVIPRDGAYKVWIRYADWAGKTESFTARITQGGRDVFNEEFGTVDVLDRHDEVSMYWGWAYTWAAREVVLKKGPARFSIAVEKAAEARRHVDCFLLTNDLRFVPTGRQKPPFAATLSIARDVQQLDRLKSLLTDLPVANVPDQWRIRTVAGRDFIMPWNISTEFWRLYDKPPAERPLYPFHTELVEEFVAMYKGVKDVPIFSSRFIAPVIYLNDLPRLLKEGGNFLRYVRETKTPFAVLINYGHAQFESDDGQAAWNLLSGELSDQFLGWISGESIGYVWDQAPTELKISPSMSRRELLEAHKDFYSRSIERKWSEMFHTPAGSIWPKLIAAQSTSSTSFAHALGQWGSRIIGLETAAVQPGFAMRLAFTRGAARQFGGSVLYYHAPNLGDTAMTFTRQQNFAGPDYFYHTRYGPTMGPSLSWYRKSYYFYYMSGASLIYLEQGFDQFFKPGPGEHPFQLNPLGKITKEFIDFAERLPDRGTPYTPVAFLLDPAHGWDMTDYPHWPFGVSEINESDRALRELFGAAYYPLLVTEGEPAAADRQAFVNGVFGDVFDVMVASETNKEIVDTYRALVVGGRIEWSREWAKKLEAYVRSGGVVYLNVEQISGLSEEFLGVRLSKQVKESDSAVCNLDDAVQLGSQVFAYRVMSPAPGTEVFVSSASGDPLVTKKQLGKGSVIFSNIPDFLGLDQRMTPAAAHALTHIVHNATPIRVKGDLEYLVNRTSRGWIVTLLNNQGITKYQQGMALVDRSKVVDVLVELKGKQISSAQNWISGQRLSVTAGGSVGIKLPPGGLAVIELIER